MSLCVSLCVCQTFYGKTTKPISTKLCVLMIFPDFFERFVPPLFVVVAKTVVFVVDVFCVQPISTKHRSPDRASQINTSFHIICFNSLLFPCSSVLCTIKTIHNTVFVYVTKEASQTHTSNSYWNEHTCIKLYESRQMNSSHLPVDVLLQTDGAVRGGAAAQRIRGSAAALALALSFRLELASLHLLQRLDGHSVHGALWWGGGRGEGGTGSERETSFILNFVLITNRWRISWHIQNYFTGIRPNDTHVEQPLDLQHVLVSWCITGGQMDSWSTGFRHEDMKIFLSRIILRKMSGRQCRFKRNSALLSSFGTLVQRLQFKMC